MRPEGASPPELDPSIIVSAFPQHSAWDPGNGWKNWLNNLRLILLLWVSSNLLNPLMVEGVSNSRVGARVADAHTVHESIPRCPFYPTTKPFLSLESLKSYKSSFSRVRDTSFSGSSRHRPNVAFPKQPLIPDSEFTTYPKDVPRSRSSIPLYWCSTAYFRFVYNCLVTENSAAFSIFASPMCTEYRMRTYPDSRAELCSAYLKFG